MLRSVSVFPFVSVRAFAPSSLWTSFINMGRMEVRGEASSLRAAPSKAAKPALDNEEEKLLWHEKAMTVLGDLMLLVVLPPVALVVGSAVLWDALDRGFMGKPLDGVTMSLARWVNRVTEKFNSKFVKHKEDAFIMNALFWLGLVVPATFVASAYYTRQNGGVHWGLLWAYHLFRIGPYFMNFAYAYTMSHKEGHNRSGFYTKANGILKYAFNRWIGLFFGMMPSFFTYGHSVNHHMYNNGPLDVVSTADRRRDSFTNCWPIFPGGFSFIPMCPPSCNFTRRANTRPVPECSWEPCIGALGPTCGLCWCLQASLCGTSSCRSWRPACCCHASTGLGTPSFHPTTQRMNMLVALLSLMARSMYFTRTTM